MQSINPAILIEKGVHHGHLAKNWDPSFKPYLFMEKNGYHIIHIAETIRGLQKAAKALKQITEEGKKILFVGTKKQIKGTVEETAKALNQPYVTKKWLGGMLTNFITIKKSIKNLRKLSEHKDDPAYVYATKKERSQKDRKQVKLEASFQGMKDLAYLPAAIFVIDVKQEYTAVLEARKLDIPIFAIVDSNVPTQSIHYPIPGNDDTVSSVKILLDLLKPSILEGMQAWEERKTHPTEKNKPEPSKETPKPTQALKPKREVPSSTEKKQKSTTSSSTTKTEEVASTAKKIAEDTKRETPYTQSPSPQKKETNEPPAAIPEKPKA